MAQPLPDRDQRTEIVGEVMKSYAESVRDYLENKNTNQEPDYKTLMDFEYLKAYNTIRDFRHNYVAYTLDNRFGYAINLNTLTSVRDQALRADDNNNVEGSDADIIDYFTDEFNMLDFGDIDEVNLPRARNEAAYFEYAHNTKDNLLKYQILHKDCDFELYKYANRYHCIEFSLGRFYAIEKDPEKKECIKQSILNFRELCLHNSCINIVNFKTADFKNFLHKDLSITLVKYEDVYDKNGNIIDVKVKGKHNKYPKYTNKETKKQEIRKFSVPIFLFRNHYMAHIDSMYKGQMRKVTYIMRDLVLNNHLSLLKYNYVVEKRLNLVPNDYMIKEQMLYPEYKPKENNNFIVYADFESIVSCKDDNNEYTHLPFMLGYVCEEFGRTKVIKAKTVDEIKNCSIFEKMLNDVVKLNKEKKNIVIYFHNLKYDYSLIKMNKFITVKNEVARNNQIYSVKIVCNKKTITLKDSAKLATMKLDDFQKSFDLKKGKAKFELYNIIDLDNFDEVMFKMDEFEKLLKSREKLTLVKEHVDIENQKKDCFYLCNYPGYVLGDFFEISRCYMNYLIDDCETLKEGMIKYREIMYSITGLDSHNYLTLSSLASDHMHKQGCFEGMYKVYGSLQKYIMQAVSGGRVCLGYKDYKSDECNGEIIEDYSKLPKKITKGTNNKIVVEGAIQDFDGVSMYPSAIVRTVYPKGPCQLVKEKSLNELSIYSQYIITVRLKINKHQQIPIMSKKIDNKRLWTNKIIKTEEITIDKVTLEDILNFNDAELLEIKYGVGWLKSNGVNDKLQHEMQLQHEERKIAKQNNNGPKSTLIKLKMNSTYGKTLISPNNFKIVYKRGKKDFRNYMNNNFCKLHSFENLDGLDDKYDRYRIKLYDTKLHNTNLAQVGCFILSMSKRIMNEVTDIANDNDIDLYYTDTDSLHMLDRDVKLLSEKYDAKYNKNLIGKELGQFHTDFCFDADNIKRNQNVMSRKFIGLGKKCYLDILVNSLGEEKYHIRFKGANSANIEKYCKDNEITVEDFYMKLFNDETIELNIADGKVRFAYKSTSVYTKKTMVKKFSFVEKNQECCQARH